MKIPMLNKRWWLISHLIQARISATYLEASYIFRTFQRSHDLPKDGEGFPPRLSYVGF
jgi:hypothetical protein